jgi:tRNA 5-methylaminomethyl-2-thiouridine biosynthesis bifunctional protein
MPSDSPQKPAKKEGAQPALTLCPDPKLDWSRAQTPASERFGDIYFSVDGGLEETQAVYLKACGLPERWDAPEFQDRAFVIGELGFGTGLNFLAAWQLWRIKPRPGQRLHFVSVEKYPLSKISLTRALESWPELAPLAARLIAHWPGRVRGAHILRLDEDVTLTLIHDEALAGLKALFMKANGWFLDGFSPARNPDMWSPQLMARLGELSAPGARIGTFTAAGAVRGALSSAGFDVRKVQGFGRKRHRLEAVMPAPKDVTPPLPAKDFRPLIIGAGIAGLCLAEAFARRGIPSTVVDADDGTAASGNAAAIIKPRLDRQDSPLARFALSAYLYALRFYGERGAAFQTGVDHAPQTIEQIHRYAALGEASPLPAAHMAWDSENSVMKFPKAQVISPKAAREALRSAALRAGAKVYTGRASGLNAGENTGVILDTGEVLKGAPILFAIGAGTRALEIFSGLDLRYSRGQISWAKNDQDARRALTYGGYAVPMQAPPEGAACAENLMLLGATHARLGTQDPYAARPEDDTQNFAAYTAATGERAAPARRVARASVRVNSKTTWPMAARLEDDIYAITGLGSRGFVFAPLLSEMLVASLLGEPCVWPRQLQKDLRAARQT